MSATTGQGAVRLVKALALSGIALYTTHAFTAGHTAITEPVQAPESRLELLSADCDEPALDTLPGSVIWRHPDGRIVRSERLVGPALDTVFAEGRLPGTPILFCA